ncbi:MAG: transcriptional repressor [Planctomycetota bacterium]
MPAPQTAQRQAIENAINAASGPLSPAEVLQAARVEVSSLSLATVYRTLKRMVTDGQLSTVDLPGQTPRYERALIAREHHHHFWCVNCDSVFDLEGCVEGLKKLLPSGFRMTSHEITLHGQCQSCEAS